MISMEILERTDIMSRLGKMSGREAVSFLNRRDIKLEWELCHVPMKMIFAGKHGGG